MSAQAFGLVRAVRDVDAAVTPDDEHRVVETHPELAFAAMAGAPLPAKRTDDGVRARRVALRGWLPEVDAAATAAPRGARVDDALDALACAWVARRWRAGQAELVGDGSRDRRGLVMRIAY
jgi:predicted RNase H-like nuclease